MFSLSFISEENFTNHVWDTIKSYNNHLQGIDLAAFNANVIDPIKLLFDKNISGKTFDEIIQAEIQRQRDKSNTNLIGYFHQRIFKYIDKCDVPDKGWDVIFNDKNRTVFVEMKNKHNTMNSAASQKTYIKMQNKILQSPKNFCYLVEALAPRSRNVPWICSLEGISYENEHIRRVSIDQFYKEVTSVPDAFFQICMQLPKTIEMLIEQNPLMREQKDSVLAELRQENPDTLKALYLLTFKTYEGFDKL